MVDNTVWISWAWQWLWKTFGIKSWKPIRLLTDAELSKTKTQWVWISLKLSTLFQQCFLQLVWISMIVVINIGKTMFQEIIKTSFNFEHLLIFINFAHLKNQRKHPNTWQRKKKAWHQWCSSFLRWRQSIPMRWCCSGVAISMRHIARMP